MVKQTIIIKVWKTLFKFEMHLLSGSNIKSGVKNELIEENLVNIQC